MLKKRNPATMPVRALEVSRISTRVTPSRASRRSKPKPTIQTRRTTPTQITISLVLESLPISMASTQPISPRFQTLQQGFRLCENGAKSRQLGGGLLPMPVRPHPPLLPPADCQNAVADVWSFARRRRESPATPSCDRASGAAYDEKSQRSDGPHRVSVAPSGAPANAGPAPRVRLLVLGYK